MVELIHLFNLKGRYQALPSKSILVGHMAGGWKHLTLKVGWLDSKLTKVIPGPIGRALRGIRDV
jgi:hypothetical protein